MSEKVLILMGSDSDFKYMKPALELLKRFEIPFKATVSSAHRTPGRTRRLLRDAVDSGTQVVIAAAGGAAHLPGVLAAETTVPVIGVPLESSPLKGMDALLAIAQMPPGVPVATMAVGSWGAVNAVVLAAQILALSDDGLRKKLVAYRQEMAASVEKKAADLEDRLKG